MSSTAAPAQPSTSASDSTPVAAPAKTPLPTLLALEDDDEFEEFPSEGTLLRSPSPSPFLSLTRSNAGRLGRERDVRREPDESDDGGQEVSWVGLAVGR